MCQIYRKGGEDMVKQSYGNGKRGQSLCQANGSSEFNEGVKQSKKTDTTKKKAIKSSKLMGSAHSTTQRHISEDLNLQHHCCQN
jgi:hypothetical protein